MANELATSAASASLALTAFWGMVTVGRVVFALAEQYFPGRNALHVLPFVAALAFASISTLPAGSPLLGIIAFGVAGLGCSALLPLVISFSQDELAAIGASVAGLLIASYQIGYGIAAFGVGPLERISGLDLRQVYGIGTVVALAMAGLSFALVSRRAMSPGVRGFSKG